jgi:hypothetical protein
MAAWDARVPAGSTAPSPHPRLTPLPEMTDQDELTFLHGCGVQLREQLDREPVSGMEARRRRARSIVSDLLAQRQACAHPIGDVLDQLIHDTPTPGVAEARIAAIRQQLQLTYNEQVTRRALSFARGCLQLGPEPPGGDPLLPLAGVGVGPETPPPGAAAALRPAAAVPPQTAAAGAPLGVVLFNQWLMLLTVLAGLGVISFVVIRALNRPQAVPQAGSPAPAAAPGGSASVSPGSTPQTTAAPPAPPPAPAVTAALYDAGIASGGQRVLLDTGSVAPTSDPSRIRFRYWLGQQVVESEADCSRRIWRTYPEGQTHAPQSPATARMLGRVCEGVASAAPASASRAGVAIVFDPPSNIRATPNGAVLCSVTSRGTIPIQGREGDWYRTDHCGSPGYIHSGQIRF